MSRRLTAGDVDLERLASYFRALSIPNRLALLRKLQLPHRASEIHLPPVRQDRDMNPDRSLSRQAVEEHLEKLLDLGLVTSRPADGQGTEYLVNHARLFVLVEEMRRLSLHCLTPGEEDTMGRESRAPEVPPVPDGPALVLANGPREGFSFTLSGAGPWTIGRDPSLDVALPFDPLVSRRNAEIRRADGAFELASLEGSRNGTSHNWRDLAPGATARLAPGDTIGVGISLLVVRGVPAP